MKKGIRKFISIMVTMMICSSFAFTVAHADAYDHIGFDTMGTSYAKDATQQLSITAYDGSGDVVTFSGDVTYSSSNENVVTVSSTGLMTMVNYGYATITATSGGKTATMLVTVRDRGPLDVMTGDSAFTRTGANTKAVTGGTLAAGADDYNVAYAKINQILGVWDSADWWKPLLGTSNAVIDVWFYDNGSTTDSIAAVYMSGHTIDRYGTRAVGIINSDDTTYKLTGIGAKRTKYSAPATNTNPQAHVGICNEVLAEALEDTGIARKKGWHQVSFIKKNTENNSSIADAGGTKSKSNYYAIYLDGQFVYEETETDRSFIYLYGYAGWDSGHTAYFADGLVSPYTCVENLALSESSGTYTINQTTYYGTKEAKTTSYKWQASDDGVTGWTDIASATSGTFTPSVATYGDKFIRGAVKLSSTNIVTDFYYTDSSYIYNGTQQYISLGKNTSSYLKGATGQQLNLVGYAKDGIERSIADLTGATFSSSNENAVTVTNAGLLSAVDYGSSIVTATYQGKTAKMLVTVRDRDPLDTMTGDSDFCRTGANTQEVTGGTVAINASTADFNVPYAKINALLLLDKATNAWQGTSTANAVTDVWFYDNGSTTDSIAAVYMSGYYWDSNGTRVVGILNSSDATYKLTNVGARRQKKNSGVRQQGGRAGICTEVTNAGFEDTGIARKKGWHQVAFIYKNTDVDLWTEADTGRKNVSNCYYIYLDGQLVHSETGVNRTFNYLYGYAGWDEGHTAYFADGAVSPYTSIEDISLSESNSTYTLNHNTYFGKKSDPLTHSYKWQASNDGVTGWTDIAGATSQTYTPTVSTRNKYVRGLVNVTADGVTTNYANSAAARPNFSLISATIGATEVNVSLRIVNDTGASIPYALLIGYYNADETEMVAYNSQINTVAAGSSKTTHTFTIPGAIRDKFSRARIFLWEDINQITPYTQGIWAE